MYNQSVKSRPVPVDRVLVSELVQEHADVLDEEVRRYFRREPPDRQEDARNTVVMYLLRGAEKFVGRLAPNHDGTVTGVRREFRAQVREPRGAFRMWARNTAHWVRRDYDRALKFVGEGPNGFEVRVVEDGVKEGGISFDRLRSIHADDTDTEAYDRDEARDLVAELTERIPAEAMEDVSLFLVAEESGDQTIYQTVGTNRAAVLKRLRALQPTVEALRRAREDAKVIPWGG